MAGLCNAHYWKLQQKTQYDGVGNRLSANRSGVVTRYILDRNSPLAQVLAETDASGNVIYYYIYGLGLVSRIDADGNAQYYGFSSTQEVFASAGASYWESYCIAKCTCGRIGSSRSMGRMKGQSI